MENPGRKPTVKQVYAIAFELCERAGEQFPDTVAEASEMIERLRIENGKPVERREEVMPGPGEEGGASTVLA